MTQMAGVRPMETADLEAVKELEQACFSEYWSENLLRQALESKFDTLFVCICQGKVAGYSVVRVLAGEGEIQRIAVFPEFRRQGIARKLMDAMTEFARREQVSAIALEVRESNVPARNLYESYGFKEEAVRKGYYHDPVEDAIIMWNRGI